MNMTENHTACAAVVAALEDEEISSVMPARANLAYQNSIYKWMCQPYYENSVIAK